MKKNFCEKAQATAGKMMEAAKTQMDKAGAYLGTKKEAIAITFKLASKKEELDELFANYGRLCYNGVLGEEAEEVKLAIASVGAEIQELEAKLEELEPEEEESLSVYCSKCGKEHDAEDEFCSKCGSQLKK